MEEVVVAAVVAVVHSVVEEVHQEAVVVLQGVVVVSEAEADSRCSSLLEHGTLPLANLKLLCSCILMLKLAEFFKLFLCDTQFSIATKGFVPAATYVLMVLSEFN